MATFGGRLKHAWSAFTKEEPGRIQNYDLGPSYNYRQDRYFRTGGSDRFIVSSIYNRLAIDVAAIDIRHVRLDKNNRFMEDISSGLNDCLRSRANIDQFGRHFRQDIAMTMFEEGVVAIVAVETDYDPETNTSSAIKSMRVGKVVNWYPRHVRVSLYDDTTATRREVVLAKEQVAIVENPLYTVMNEPNSTLQRLIRKLALLDTIDEQAGSGKLDLIIQLPYVVKTESRRQQAEQRRQQLEDQMQGSKYGIAYTDGTEKITQLNRPAENNMLAQVEYLTTMLYGQLGLTEEVFNGTADEKAMLNYYNRTIEPILTAITEALKGTFLSKTARTQGQSIEFFRDPFRLVPISELAEIADKFTRNEILSSNEFRGIIGYRPSEDPKADELRNKNVSAALQPPGPQPSVPMTATPVRQLQQSIEQ